MQSDMPSAFSVEYDVVTVEDRKVEHTNAVVAVEVPFAIVVNGVELATLMCTPKDLKELCYGFLCANGIIENGDDVLSYEYDRDNQAGRVSVKELPDLSSFRKRFFTSSKGVVYSSVAEVPARQRLNTSFKVDRKVIFDLLDWLQHTSDLFKKSGGVHSAALSENGRIPQRAIDDIGRHNTVDKVIGDGLLRGIDFSRSVLICSGRISSDMLFKAKRCGIPVSVSRSAPTHQAVATARETGVTVIGFARGKRFTIYAHPERISGLR